MKTRFIKILAGFLMLALLQNLAFPFAANHGKFDTSNEEFQPYLFMGVFSLIELIFVIMVIYNKPSTSSILYKFGKVVIPLTFITLLINITRMVPLSWGFLSTLLFLVQIFGLLISLWLSISFLTSRTIKT